VEWLRKGYQNNCYNVNQKDAWTEENLGKDGINTVGTVLITA
jgi:hypothetical protein